MHHSDIGVNLILILSQKGDLVDAISPHYANMVMYEIMFEIIDCEGVFVVFISDLVGKLLVLSIRGL